MKVLVTGANGLVGSRLVPMLASRGHAVTATGRGAQRGTLPAGVTYASVELTRADEVKRLVDELRPEVIVNPAGMTDVDGCERDRAGAYAANVEAVAALARASTDVQAHLIHVSTDYVFDGAAGPYDVDAVPNPRGTYAVTKAAGELATQALASSWAIARTAVVYGWPQAARPNFGSWLVSSLKAGTPVKLFEDQWVSPSLASNVAEQLVELAERRLTGMFHTSGAEVVDRVTFGLQLARRFRFDEKLITPSRMSDLKLASPRPAKSGLVVTKTAQTLKAQPASLATSLERFYVEWEHTP